MAQGLKAAWLFAFRGVKAVDNLNHRSRSAVFGNGEGKPCSLFRNIFMVKYKILQLLPYGMAIA